MELIPVGDVAKYFGVDVTNLTVETFNDMYKDAWNKYDTKTISHATASDSTSIDRTKSFGMMLVSIVMEFVIV